MIVHEVQIPYTYGQSITLKPVFDVHLGNKFCDERAFQKYLSNADDSTYLIGGGDLLDAIVTKDIRRYTKSADNTISDAIIDEQIDKAEHYLAPYKGRILGLGTGNHESAITKYHGTNPIKRLARRLDTVSLGFSWIVRIRFREGNGRGRTLTIRGHHGWGGGSRTQGADLTKYSRDVQYWKDANVFVYGHVHRRQADKIDCMGIVGSKLYPMPRYIFICGTFLKTYSDTDEATYSEEKGYPPVAIGGLDIFVKPNADWLDISNNL